MFYLREGFKKSSSDPSQPGRALDKKNSKITQIFIIFIITKFGEKKKFISASFQMFWWKKWKSKSVTNSRDFFPDPPNNENFKVFSFMDELDHSDHLCICFENNIFFDWILAPC